MSKHWSERLAELSVEQLEDLISELGEIAILTRALNAQLLMRALPGLQWRLACALTCSTEDPWQTGSSDPIARELKHVFVRLRCSRKQLDDVCSFCSSGGLKSWQRAVDAYLQDPTYQARVIGGEDILETVVRAAVADDVLTPVEAQRRAGECAAEFAVREAEEAREWLRDELGIEGLEDWHRLMDAGRCVAKANPDLMMTPGRESARSLALQIRRLCQQSQSMNCMPSQLMQWREVKRMIAAKRANPNEIFTRPDGQQVYGDGTPVLRDRNGNPRRRTETVFGVRHESGIPDYQQVEDAVRRGFGQNV